MGGGIVLPFSGTLIILFFAISMPFLMAIGTSFALPAPYPTRPCPSPTTTRAENEKFLPPWTTFVTRLMCTTWSMRSAPARPSPRAPAGRGGGPPGRLPPGRFVRGGRLVGALLLKTSTPSHERLLRALLRCRGRDGLRGRTRRPRCPSREPARR